MLFCLKRFCIKIFFNKKFKEIVVLYLRLVPLHPHDGCKWLHCHGETFEILDIDEAPQSHSNGFYILENSFSLNSCFFYIVSQTQFIRTCHDHRRLFVFALRDNLVPNANLFSSIHVSCYLKSELQGWPCSQAVEF